MVRARPSRKLVPGSQPSTLRARVRSAARLKHAHRLRQIVMNPLGAKTGDIKNRFGGVVDGNVLVGANINAGTIGDFLASVHHTVSDVADIGEVPVLLTIAPDFVRVHLDEGFRN